MGLSEKEAVNLVREYYSEGFTNSQIIRKFQSKGYKLEYIDSLIKRAIRPKKILITCLIVILFLIPTYLATYLFIYTVNVESVQNPLENIKNNSIQNNSNIEINEETISYLLYSLGAGKLKTNPITFKKPIIETQIDGISYYTIITNGKIETKKASNEKSDLLISTSKEIIINFMLEDDKNKIFSDSLAKEEIKIEIFSSQPDLFAKGYLNFYENLKNN